MLHLICCSNTQSCLTFWDPLDWSTSGFPVLHHLPEPCSNSWPLNWWCHPTISSSVILFSFCLQSLLASGSFLISWLFTSGCQSSGASASVLPMNIQGCFPLGLTGLISLLSKGLSRVFSSILLTIHIVGEQNLPLQNISLACRSFQAETIKAQKTQEETLTFLLTA